VLERRRVQQGLQRRPRLARRDGHVDVPAVRRIPIGRAPDHREDPSGPRLDRHEGAVRDVAIGERGEAQPHQPFDLGLQTGIEGRLDDQPVATR